jgi:hypothetical protein
MQKAVAVPYFDVVGVLNADEADKEEFHCQAGKF